MNEDNLKAKGRPKGSKNKTTNEIRLMFQNLLASNIDTIQIDLNEMKPIERVNAILKLASFCVPTLKAIDLRSAEPIESKIFSIKDIFKTKTDEAKN